MKGRSRENVPFDRLKKMKIYCGRMSELCQKYKKVGVTNFVLVIKQVENHPDIEKMAHVIQHGPLGRR